MHRQSAYITALQTDPKKVTYFINPKPHIAYRSTYPTENRLISLDLKAKSISFVSFFQAKISQLSLLPPESFSYGRPPPADDYI